MQITITDSINEDYKETRELTPSQIVDIIDDSVKSGKWKKTENFFFDFQDDADWEAECFPFIKTVVEEMAIRDVLPSFEHQSDFPVVSTGFYHNRLNKGAKINKDIYNYEPRSHEYIADIDNINHGLTIIGYQAISGRPIPPSKIDPKYGPRLNCDMTA